MSTQFEAYPAVLGLFILGQPTVYGDLKTYYISSDGNPYLTAPEGFTVEEVKPVRKHADIWPVFSFITLASHSTVL